jgi:hypothetical protein
MKPRLLTFSSGGWVLLLAGFFSLVAAALVLYPVWDTGFRRAIGDGKNIDTYGFDLSTLTVPRGELSASAMPKDGIKVIPEARVETVTPAEVELIAANEHRRFLVPSDVVIGLFINGVARAYPLRLLTHHELVNDTVGGVPVAVTYTPLCDASVVFDRRIDGAGRPAVEFGHSGLYRSSNTIFYDRRAEAKQESLWPQLAMRAIAGPAAHGGAAAASAPATGPGAGGAAQALTLVPYERVTWEEWRKAHPDTRVLLGLRSMKKEYSGDPYNVYFHSDLLKYPSAAVAPNLPGRLPNKTPIVVTSADGVRWTAGFATMPAPAGAGANRVHAFLFAWAAQHPADTDYSALEK